MFKGFDSFSCKPGFVYSDEDERGKDKRDTISEPAWPTNIEKGLQIVPVEELIPDLSEVSLWVLNQMQVVSQFLGVSFEGVKGEVVALFTTLEREIYVTGFVINHRRVHRELQNVQLALQSSSSGRRKIGSSARKKIGV